ncbi:MarR family transcriptional regulator [Paenibacillus urinalis]|uniref:MarR family transcriptional regulator n=1 Tax=Paenibacillus urinalis TaxID=521520 RepID=UPI00195F3D92
MTDDSGVQKKDRLINELMGTVNALQQKFQGEEDEEKQWLIQNSPNPVIAELMKDMTVNMLHVLSAIGKLEPVNGITISKQFGFSKGNVSKITRRLADKKIIDFEYIPGNKKEVLFRTTSLGREINRLHEALHQKIDIGVHRFLQRYDEEELEFLVKVLHETWQTSWIYPETNENPNELSQSTNEVPGNPIVSKEMSEVTEMLNKLDSHDLKKAKAILHAVFFSE